MGAADKTDIDVKCVINTYTVGGEVTGLFGGSHLRLKIKNTVTNEEVELNELGRFMFHQRQAHLASYSVSIVNQPEGYWCVLKDNSGKIDARDVNKINIECDLRRFQLGGKVTGEFEGNLVLEATITKNGKVSKQRISAAKVGSFMFSDKVMWQSTWQVAVRTQPTGYSCTISGNSGTMGTQD